MNLTPKQISYVRQIIGTVQARRLSMTAAIACVTTALVESNLQNYANSNVPVSMSIPHDAVGSDHASLGIYQQQTGYSWTKSSSMGSPNGWGVPASLMDIIRSTNNFLDALVKFNWQAMSIGSACQHVQGSAFPDRYAARAGEATAIVKLYWDGNIMTAPQVAQLQADVNKLLSFFEGNNNSGEWRIENLVWEVLKPSITLIHAEIAAVKTDVDAIKTHLGI